MHVERLVTALGIAQAGIVQPFIQIDEARTVATAIAEEVAVDRGVEAVVHALELAVALAGQGIAAPGAAGAHRGRGLQIPLARVVVDQGLVGEHAGGADLDEVAGELALEHAVL
jgi:hypothetical protein